MLYFAERSQTDKSFMRLEPQDSAVIVHRDLLVTRTVNCALALPLPPPLPLRRRLQPQPQLRQPHYHLLRVPFFLQVSSKSSSPRGHL
ncbi:hypothetical protein Y032_0005g2394 [Ancylostoma ceylanicum]|uniref:Uncharacterized protein n=1 Tax=Ancylostoma ceylanicum TaxID=53326 RepID=A0A016VSK3_9BILA|nr:hypothetical protein Y032_0005g2394 [Ancylostoma ceylanicum]